MFSSIAQEIWFHNYLVIFWMLVLWAYRTMLISRQPVLLERFSRYDYKNKTPISSVILTVAPLVIWAGFRPDVEDTNNYRNGFLSGVQPSFGYIKSVINSSEKGKGYFVLSSIIKRFIGNNDVLFFIIIALIIVGIISYVYRRTSVEYQMSMFLYMISCDYYSWNFNGIRQGLAVSFAFLALFLLFERKYIPALILLLIAYSVHSSAIIIIIALFIFNQKPWSWRVISIVFGFVLAIFFLSQFTTLLNNILSGTSYSNAVAQFERDDGVSPLRVIVYSVPIIIAFFSRKQIDEQEDVVINFAVNMSLIGVAFYVLGMFTSGIFIGRLPIYFTLWNYVLLAWEINNLLDKRAIRTLVKIVMVLFYGYYNYYQMQVFI